MVTPPRTRRCRIEGLDGHLVAVRAAERSAR